MDVLFVEPMIGNKYGIISLGMLSLTTFLKRHGYESKLITIDVHKARSAVTKTIEQHEPRVVCIGLHWYVHSHAALEISKAIKQTNTEVKVVVGGHTATYFGAEILRLAPYIDVLIKGDGEKPLLDYVSTMNPNKTENASFIREGKLINKPITYKQHTLKGQSTTCEKMSELVDDWDKYIKESRIRTAVMLSSEEFIAKKETKPNEFYLYLGKGCRNNCCYCAGSKTSCSRIYERERTLFRPLSEVLKDIENLMNNGINDFFLDFGPFDDETYYIKLFNRLRGLGLSLRFLPWKLPSEELILTIQRNFEHFDVRISPDSGSERLRQYLWRMGFHRPFYINKQLMRLGRYLNLLPASSEAQLYLYFVAGLPFETKHDFRKTLELTELFRRRFQDIISDPREQLNCLPLRIEPGSPLDLFPNLFGIKKLRSTFKSYYDYCGELSSGRITHPLGLERNDLSESEIVKRVLEFRQSVV